MMAAPCPASPRGLLINGQWTATGEWLDVRSPYDGSAVAQVAKGGKKEMRRAVDAAARAFGQPLVAYRRAEILTKVARLLEQRHEEAARTVSAEAGKPIKAARVEVTRAISTYTFAATVARTLAGEMIPMEASAAGENKLAYTMRLPIGVVGAIAPFNFPLNLVAHKIAPALAAGCPVVLKPASQTPLSALLLGELSLQAGLPAGWLNVVPGDAEQIADVLIEDERVRHISFTGSARVGWALRMRAARKRVSLELGNSTPAIVEADADIGLAASRLAAGAFSFAGQSCVSVQRIYVHHRVYREFKSTFLPLVNDLVVGNPADEATDVGPLISESERDRVIAAIESARDSGANVLTGGRLVGSLLPPTVVENPAPTSEISRVEVFGPVCTLQSYDELSDAITLANGTRYGLQAGIFTRSVSTALRAAQSLEFGGVTINEAPTFRADQMPYGGVKDSGNTREGPAWSVHEMTEERLVVINL